MFEQFYMFGTQPDNDKDKGNILWQAAAAAAPATPGAKAGEQSLGSHSNGSHCI